ncbi:hypothetical protein C8A00DRAFT_47516 [Chaetomidium leptoderma]|uniref:Uncharacterized protein n=1 Tax=Chaetomidium leptoderma TaxID=669021 RepID=A0AAN6VD60_9PEZI|nr:hypothetical protein C8A00DRAFT_47516 [Chaetomidium leptoderma]
MAIFNLQPSAVNPPGKAVVSLGVVWTVWLVIIAVCITGPSLPPDPKVIYGLICLPLLAYILGLIFDQVLVRSAGQPTKRKHSRNLWSTVITLLVTAIVFPVLYQCFWYPDRIRNVIELSQDTVRADWSSQANLGVSVPGKCFIGWYDENAPDCNELAPGTTPCQCAGSWGQDVMDFKWQNISFRALTLISTSSMVSLAPTTQMIAQAFFTCEFFPPYDTAKALADSSRVLLPSLWIAVYDPTLTLQEALENGYTRMNLINANGVAAINLGLNYREALGKAPTYDYQLSISAIPSTDLQCDVSSEDKNTGYCFLSLFLQFPTFDRLVSRQGTAMSPVELISAAGSWFALFQLLGWLLSGLAFDPG